MALANKNSILHRPIMRDVKSHLQSVDVEHEKQLRRDEARKARKEELRTANRFCVV